MTEHHLPDVVVTDRAVYFDGVELPWYIAEDGISFKPVVDGFHSLTVEFLVESATFQTSWETRHADRWRHLKHKVSFGEAYQRHKISQLEQEYAL